MESDKLSPFGKRLLEVFGGVQKSKIAEVMRVKSSAVTNYLQDRIPDADKLQLISDFTNCSIHWLITGVGEKFLSVEKPVNLDETFREVIREIVREEINSPEHLGKISANNIKNEKEKMKSPSNKE